MVIAGGKDQRNAEGENSTPKMAKSCLEEPTALTAVLLATVCFTCCFACLQGSWCYFNPLPPTKPAREHPLKKTHIWNVGRTIHKLLTAKGKHQIWVCWWTSGQVTQLICLSQDARAGGVVDSVGGRGLTGLIWSPPSPRNTVYIKKVYTCLSPPLSPC